MPFKIQYYIISYATQNASYMILALIGLICLHIKPVLSSVSLLRFSHQMCDFPLFLVLLGDTQSYDVKHHNSFHLVCLHGSNQQ